MEDNDRGSPKLSNDVSDTFASLDLSSSSSSSSSLSSNTNTNNLSSTSPISLSSSSSSATTTTVTGPVYHPPSLVLLSAVSVAEHINTLLLTQRENFYYLSEENLLLVFTMIIQNMKLTPKIVLVLRDIAAQRGYRILQSILDRMDVSSGIIITGNTQCRDTYF